MKSNWKRILLAFLSGTLLGTIVILAVIYFFYFVHIIETPIDWLYYGITAPLIALFSVCCTLYFGKKLSKNRKD